MTIKVVIQEPTRVVVDPHTGAQTVRPEDLRVLKEYDFAEHPEICQALMLLHMKDVFVLENGIPAQLHLRGLSLAEGKYSIVVQLLTQVQAARPEQVPPHPSEGPNRGPGPGPGRPRIVQP